MSSIKGIRQDLFCKKNTLLLNPAELFGSGLSDSHELNIQDEGVAEHRGGTIVTGHKHEYKRKSYQSTLTQLKRAMHEFCYSGADLQVVSNKYYNGLYGSVFNYTGNNRFMGVDLKFMLASKERSLELTAKQIMDVDEHLSFMQDSMTALPKDLNALGIGHRGVVPADFRRSNLTSIISPSGTVYIDKINRVSHNITIESISSELEDGRPDVSFFRVIAEFILNKASSWEIVNYLTQSDSPYLELQETVSPGVVEKYIFEPGVLRRLKNFKLSKDDRFQRFVFTRDIPMFDFAFDLNNNKVTVSEQV